MILVELDAGGLRAVLGNVGHLLLLSEHLDLLTLLLRERHEVVEHVLLLAVIHPHILAKGALPVVVASAFLRAVPPVRTGP